MSLGKGLIKVGLPACTTDTADVFGDSSGIALYTLDYDASDASGNYDGTPTDVEFGVGGQINYGARFNGTSSIIQDVLGSGFTYAGKTMTFSAWIYVTDNTNDNVIIGDGFTTAAGGWAIATGYGAAPNQRLSFSIASSAVGGVQQTYSSVSIADNTWTHIAVSVNFSAIATNSSIKMYINGTEDTSLTDGITTSFVENTLYNSSIGGTWTGAAGRLFEGSIDQVRIFNKALNSTEVSTLYAETACVYTCTTDTVDYPTTNVAYYKLDNDATDEVGSYDGTETNITYEFGRFGQAAVFNGSSSYITSSLSKTDIANTFSVSFWWKPSSSTSYQVILGHYEVVGSTAYGWQIYEYNNQIGFYWIISTSPNTSNTFTNNTILQQGQWYHVVATITPTSANLYVDTSSASSSPSQGSDFVIEYSSNPTFYIGRQQGASPYYADGSIDQVRIFSSALDSDQVTQLYEEKPCADTSTFKTVLYEGNDAGSNTISQLINNVGFRPDLVWIKNRDHTLNHVLMDSVRGDDLILHSNTTDDEASAYGGTLAIEDTGFTTGKGDETNKGLAGYNDFVAYCWKAGGQAVSNTNGSITSQVSANTSAGFSIVKYTGNLSGATTATGQSVGHGLSSPPELIIFKRTSGTSDWWIMSSELTNWSTRLMFDDSNTLDYYSQYPMADPTSDVFYTNYITAINVSASDYIAYCWHSVAGVSKVGSYIGAGSGTRVYTTSDGTSTGTGGFRPSWVMLKNASVGGTGYDWYIYDVRRDDGDGDDNLESYLTANNSTAEITSNTGSNGIVMEDDGFTLDISATSINGSGNTFIYLAFA